MIHLTNLLVEELWQRPLLFLRGGPPNEKAVAVFQLPIFKQREHEVLAIYLAAPKSDGNIGT